MRKRKILVFALAVLLVAIAATGTAAYFTAQKTARNVITTGKIDIEIVEMTLNHESSELVEYPTDPISVIPGDSVSKVVSVLNNDEDSYIRVKYIVTVNDSEGNIIEPENNDWYTLSIGDEWITKSEDDGWYYYSESVATGQSTDPFINSVDFDTSMSNDFANCSITVEIIAQAVQSDNNGNDVLSAEGWLDAE